MVRISTRAEQILQPVYNLPRQLYTFSLSLGYEHVAYESECLGGVKQLLV